jgi:hypothetical protein
MDCQTDNGDKDYVSAKIVMDASIHQPKCSFYCPIDWRLPSHTPTTRTNASRSTAFHSNRLRPGIRPRILSLKKHVESRYPSSRWERSLSQTLWRQYCRGLHLRLGPSSAFVNEDRRAVSTNAVAYRNLAALTLQARNIWYTREDAHRNYRLSRVPGTASVSTVIG